MDRWHGRLHLGYLNATPHAVDQRGVLLYRRLVSCVNQLAKPIYVIHATLLRGVGRFTSDQISYSFDGIWHGSTA
eukprot:5898000-Pleurochrysis_carterae.AAC.3